MVMAMVLLVGHETPSAVEWKGVKRDSSRKDCFAGLALLSPKIGLEQAVPVISNSRRQSAVKLTTCVLGRPPKNSREASSRAEAELLTVCSGESGSCTVHSSVDFGC